MAEVKADSHEFVIIYIVIIGGRGQLVYFSSCLEGKPSPV